jgi:hypothetical protein
LLGFWIVVAHLLGDYVIQTDWMANEKTRRWWPAIVHAITYTVPYMLITQSPLALLAIAGTHAVIDRYRLAKHLCWAKNQLAPKSYRNAWDECRATGYPPDRPAWMSVWLMIIADNTVHLLINAAAILWL